MNPEPPEFPRNEMSGGDGDAGSGQPAQPSAGESGCALVGGAIAGFILFLVGGLTVMSVGRNGPLGIPYLVIAGIAGIWLATKPGFRGLAIGIFLGLGGVLLLLAICSGFHIN